MAKKPIPETLQWSIQQRQTGFTLNVTFGKESNETLIPYVKVLALKACQLKKGFDYEAAIKAELGMNAREESQAAGAFDPLKHEGTK